MTARSALASAVDPAPIAAAVVDALTIPTANEIATAVAAAVPDAADIATQSQSGATAAITAASLPTAAQVATAVAAAVPDTADNTASAEMGATAALDAAAHDLLSAEFDHVGGDADVWIIEPSLGQTIEVYGFVVRCEVASQTGWHLTQGLALEDVANTDVGPVGALSPGSNFVLAPGTRRCFVLETGDGLISTKNFSAEIHGVVFYKLV